MKRGEKIVNAWKRVKIKTETTPIFKFPPLFSWLAPPPVADFRELRKRSLFSGNLWTKPIADCKTWQIHVILFLAVDFQREVPKNTFYIGTKEGLAKEQNLYWIFFGTLPYNCEWARKLEKPTNPDFMSQFHLIHRESINFQLFPEHFPEVTFCWKPGTKIFNRKALLFTFWEEIVQWGGIAKNNCQLCKDHKIWSKNVWYWKIL